MSAKFSVKVMYFTFFCREGTFANRGMGNIAFGGIRRTYYMDGPGVG